MTVDALRADADRREALARAATPGDWRPLLRRADTATVWAVRSSIAHELREQDAAHIAANDPPSALAACERDRLLADCIEAMGELGLSLSVDGGPTLQERFAKLEAK